VVARHIEQGLVRAADQVLEEFEGQVAARDDDVRPQVVQGFAPERLLQLVGDRQQPDGHAGKRANL